MIDLEEARITFRNARIGGKMGNLRFLEKVGEYGENLISEDEQLCDKIDSLADEITELRGEGAMLRELVKVYTQLDNEYEELVDYYKGGISEAHWYGGEETRSEIVELRTMIKELEKELEEEKKR